VTLDSPGVAGTGVDNDAEPPRGLEDAEQAEPVDPGHDLTFHDLPEVLTVEEAARVLRIGRNAAYEQAKRWTETGGSEGLPVVHFGRSLRVPRRALAQLMSIEVSGRRPSSPARRPDSREDESA
jgi:hypothetical protein